MTKKITISFSIHYKTYYGQELYLNLDDSTSRKLQWTENDIWMGTITLPRPRTLRWSYSVYVENTLQRQEQIKMGRRYTIDSKHNYFHIFDQWDMISSSVSPLSFKEEKKEVFRTTAKRIVHKPIEQETKKEDEIQIQNILANVFVQPQHSKYIQVNSFFTRTTSPKRFNSVL